MSSWVVLGHDSLHFACFIICFYFFCDGDISANIEKLLNETQSSVDSFALFVVGEGIEKKVDDFAAEVAAQMANKS